MRVSVSDLTSLDDAIDQHEYSDYVYMYPPRQAYRPMLEGSQEVSKSVRASLSRKSGINLYIHIPFCAQICRFCNLYTTAIHDTSIYDEYVNRVLREAETYVEQGLISKENRWQTVYLGGGTPSALPLATLERLMRELESRLFIREVEETAIEVAPET